MKLSDQLLKAATVSNRICPLLLSIKRKWLLKWECTLLSPDNWLSEAQGEDSYFVKKFSAFLKRFKYLRNLCFRLTNLLLFPRLSFLSFLSSLIDFFFLFQIIMKLHFLGVNVVHQYLLHLLTKFHLGYYFYCDDFLYHFHELFSISFLMNLSLIYFLDSWSLLILQHLSKVYR